MKKLRRQCLGKETNELVHSGRDNALVRVVNTQIHCNSSALKFIKVKKDS